MTAATAAPILSHHPSATTTKPCNYHPFLFTTPPSPNRGRPISTRIYASSSSSSSSSSANKTPTDKLTSPPTPRPTPTPSKKPFSSSSSQSRETIFFDGGAHYGDLVANLLLGFTLLWLPLTLAAVSRAFFLRYRFSNLRVTVISGLTGQDRNDFSYDVIKDVQVVPRFIGEWGDVVITLKDGTKVDLRSVPRFREIARYCLANARKPAVLKENGPKGFGI